MVEAQQSFATDAALPSSASTSASASPVLPSVRNGVDDTTDTQRDSPSPSTRPKAPDFKPQIDVAVESAADPGRVLPQPVSLKRLWQYQLKDAPVLAAGYFSALINGANMPVWARVWLVCVSTLNLCACSLQCMSIVISAMLDVLFTPDSAKLNRDSLFYMGMFLLIAGVAAVGAFVQSWMFGVAGERLTKRLRQDAFAAILRQDMTFFDSPVRAATPRSWCVTCHLLMCV